jgi:DNA-binding TFAR19-related protein (PDSD5 family)
MMCRHTPYRRLQLASRQAGSPVTHIGTAALLSAVLCDAVSQHAVARIALVKPDKARNVENMILAAAQRGALQSKVCAVAGRGKRPFVVCSM